MPLAIVALLGFFALFQSESGYNNEYNTRKWIDAQYVAVCVISLLLMAIGCYFGNNSKKAYFTRPGTRGLNLDRIVSCFYTASFICILAYAVWYLNFALQNGVSAFLSVFSASEMNKNMYLFRANSGRIAGITSFTAAGVVMAIIGALLLQRTEIASEKRTKVVLLLAIVFALALFRAIAFSERLALIELVVPFAISWFINSFRPVRRIEKWIPIFAILGLVLLFGVFEYSRSWLSYYSAIYDSFWDYISIRLFGYYSNAFNTEAMYFQLGEYPNILPYWTIQWLWQMPGFEGVYSAVANPNVANQFSNLLLAYANPEFNNPGGVLTFFKDYSFAGFVLYFILGYVIGRSYQGAIGSYFTSQLLYPIYYLTLLELPRYFYLGVNRGFVVVVMVLLVVVISGNSSLSRSCVSSDDTVRLQLNKR